MTSPRAFLAVASVVALCATSLGTASSAAASAAAANTGPSTTTAPYILPVAPGVTTTSILTVGDAADNGYVMAGIPDGLGAYDNGDGTFTVLMNHELGSDKGVLRSHGAIGAFVPSCGHCPPHCAWFYWRICAAWRKASPTAR